MKMFGWLSPMRGVHKQLDGLWLQLINIEGRQKYIIDLLLEKDKALGKQHENCAREHWEGIKEMFGAHD